jgi:hypothetical protein
LSKEPIAAAPIVVGDVVYVEDVEGEIGAFRVGKEHCRGLYSPRIDGAESAQGCRLSMKAGAGDDSRLRCPVA